MNLIMASQYWSLWYLWYGAKATKQRMHFFLKITYRQKASTSRSATIHVLFLTSNNLSLNSLQIWFKAALASRVELVPDLALHCRHFHLLSHSKVPFSWKRSTQGSKSANMIPEQTGGDEYGKMTENLCISCNWWQ